VPVNPKSEHHQIDPGEGVNPKNKPSPANEARAYQRSDDQIHREAVSRVESAGPTDQGSWCQFTWSQRAPFFRARTLNASGFVREPAASLALVPEWGTGVDHAVGFQRTTEPYAVGARAALGLAQRSADDERQVPGLPGSDRGYKIRIRMRVRYFAHASAANIDFYHPVTAKARKPEPQVESSNSISPEPSSPESSRNYQSTAPQSQRLLIAEGRAQA
jgi:hypothetical protein